MTDSLRYEVAKAIALDTAAYSRPEPSDYSLADTVLATVRRHVEALPELHCDSDDTRRQCPAAVWWPLIESGIWTDAHVLADTILGVES